MFMVGKASGGIEPGAGSEANKTPFSPAPIRTNPPGGTEANSANSTVSVVGQIKENLSASPTIGTAPGDDATTATPGVTHTQGAEAFNPTATTLEVASPTTYTPTTDATTPLNLVPQTPVSPSAGQQADTFQSPIATPEHLNSAARSNGSSVNSLDSFRGNLYNGNPEASITKSDGVTQGQIDTFNSSTSVLNVSNVEATPIPNLNYGVDSNGNPTFMSLNTNGKIETTNADGIVQTKFGASAIATNPTLYNKPTPEATPAQGHNIVTPVPDINLAVIDKNTTTSATTIDNIGRTPLNNVEQVNQLPSPVIKAGIEASGISPGQGQANVDISTGIERVPVKGVTSLFGNMANALGLTQDNVIDTRSITNAMLPGNLVNQPLLPTGGEANINNPLAGLNIGRINVNGDATGNTTNAIGNSLNNFFGNLVNFVNGTDVKPINPLTALISPDAANPAPLSDATKNILTVLIGIANTNNSPNATIADFQFDRMLNNATSNNNDAAPVEVILPTARNITNSDDAANFEVTVRNVVLPDIIKTALVNTKMMNDKGELTINVADSQQSKALLNAITAILKPGSDNKDESALTKAFELMLKGANKSKVEQINRLLILNSMFQEKLNDKRLTQKDIALLNREIALNNTKINVELSKLLVKSQLKNNDVINTLNKDIKNFIGVLLAKAELKPQGKGKAESAEFGLAGKGDKDDKAAKSALAGKAGKGTDKALAKGIENAFGKSALNGNGINPAKLMLKAMAKEFKTNEIVLKNSLRFIARNLELCLTLCCQGRGASLEQFNGKNLNSFTNLFELDLKTCHDRLFTNKFVSNHERLTSAPMGYANSMRLLLTMIFEHYVSGLKKKNNEKDDESLGVESQGNALRALMEQLRGEEEDTVIDYAEFEFLDDDRVLAGKEHIESEILDIDVDEINDTTKDTNIPVMRTTHEVSAYEASLPDGIAAIAEKYFSDKKVAFLIIQINIANNVFKTKINGGYCDILNFKEGLVIELPYPFEVTEALKTKFVLNYRVVK